MKNKWMLALAAATALIPAAAFAQDGRGREGRGMGNAERAARFERARDSGVQVGVEARGGVDRPVRPTFRDRPQPTARPAPDAGVRPQRGEGFGPRGDRPRFRGDGQPGRPGFNPGEVRPDRPGVRPDGDVRPDRPAFRSGLDRRPDARPGSDVERPAFEGDRRQRFGGWRDRRDDERLLGQGPEGRERFSRERQDANRRLEQRGDLRTGRQDWRRDDDRRGDGRERDRRWDRDDDRTGRGNDWNRNDWNQGGWNRNVWNGSDRHGGWDRGNWNRGGWDRDWRRDRRYDWRGYRTANRSLYRLPRYYAPRGYAGGYRRFGIGFTMSSLLFAPDYWIDDPFSYRLPDADGPYRWVRYYNDALLVDLETGEVIDVEYDIFW